MEQELSEKEYPPVSISFDLDARANKALTIAASKSGRTKKQEAKIRMHDHLAKYECISVLNKAHKREEEGI